MYLQRIWWWVGLAHSAWLATIGLLEASGRIALSGAVFRLGSRSLERADSWLCASLAYPGEARHKRVLTASGATATMQLLIQEVPATDAPIDLLLIADPSKDKVLSYLSRSRCFVASSEPIVGVCVVQPLGEGAYELMSIAVPPSHQKCGYGTALLKWVIDSFANLAQGRLSWVPAHLVISLPFTNGMGFGSPV